MTVLQGAEIYITFLTVGDNEADLHGMVVHGYFEADNTPQMVTTFLQGNPPAKAKPTQTCTMSQGMTIGYDALNCNSDGLKLFPCPNDPYLSNGGENACLPYSTGGVGFYASNTLTSDGLTQNLHIGGFPGSSYLTSWYALGSNSGAKQRVTTTWTQSSETSTSKNTSSTFSAGLQEVVKIPFEVGSSTTTLSTDYTTTTTTNTVNVVSETQTTSDTLECDTSFDCSQGELYQWKTSATDIGNGQPSSITTCFFACVPQYLGPIKPQCPAGACSDSSCQCCNAYWSDNHNPATIDYRTPGLNGTCHPPTTTELEFWAPGDQTGALVLPGPQN